MKTKILILLFIFILSFCSSHTLVAQNLKIIYAVSKNKTYFENKRTDSIPSSFYNKMDETMAQFDQIKYTMLVEEQKAIFWMNESMENDNNSKMNIARLIAGFGSGSYFSDEENQIKLHETDAYGSNFLISLPYDEPK